MVEIYSISETVIRPVFHCLPTKINETSWRVSKDHHKAAFKIAKA